MKDLKEKLQVALNVLTILAILSGGFVWVKTKDTLDAVQNIKLAAYKEQMNIRFDGMEKNFTSQIIGLKEQINIMAQALVRLEKKLDDK